MKLRPANLNPEPARDVRASDITARAAPLRPLKDTTIEEHRVPERRPEAGQIPEHRPVMKSESDREMSLNAMPISPARMNELTERRVTARPLGWTIPGARVRTDREPGDQAQESSTNSRS